LTYSIFAISIKQAGKKPVLSMISKIKEYFKESYYELKKVNWPTKNETVRLTIVVIGFSLAVAAFLGLLDIVFSYLFSQIIL